MVSKTIIYSYDREIQFLGSHPKKMMEKHTNM